MEKLNQKSLMISEAIKVSKSYLKCVEKTFNTFLFGTQSIHLRKMHFGFRLIIAIWYYLWLRHSLLTHLDMFDRLYRIGTSPSPYRWQSYYFSLYQGDSLQWLKGYNYFEYQRTSFLCCHTCSIIFMIHIHAYIYI